MALLTIRRVVIEAGGADSAEFLALSFARGEIPYYRTIAMILMVSTLVFTPFAGAVFTQRIVIDTSE